MRHHVFVQCLPAVCACLLLCGCESARIDMGKFQLAAEKTMGDTGDDYYLVIPSQGGLNDAMVSSLSATFGPSALSQQMAAVMLKGQTERVNLAVTGHSRGKNKQSIIDACKLNKDGHLNYLNFMYVGFVEDNEAIAAAVEETGAVYFFEPITGILENPATVKN